MGIFVSKKKDEDEEVPAPEPEQVPPPPAEEPRVEEKPKPKENKWKYGKIKKTMFFFIISGFLYISWRSIFFNIVFEFKSMF